MKAATAGFRPTALAGVALLAGAVLTGPPAAFAQAPATSAGELTGLVIPGERAIVVTTDGRRLAGALVGVDAAAVTMRTPSGTETLPFDHVGQVAVRRRDSPWNGVLVGAGIGALGGLVPDHYDDCAECHDALYGSIVAGAGIGLLTDLVMRSSRVIYRAPAGRQALSLGWQVTRGRTGVTVRWAF